jgi:hypothetical protein
VRHHQPAGEIAGLAGVAIPAAAAALLEERALELRLPGRQSVGVQPRAAEDGEVGEECLRLRPLAVANVCRLDQVARRGRCARLGGAGRAGRAIEALQLPGDALHLPADLVGHGGVALGRLALAGHAAGLSWPHRGGFWSVADDARSAGHRRKAPQQGNDVSNQTL